MFFISFGPQPQVSLQIEPTKRYAPANTVTTAVSTESTALLLPKTEGEGIVDCGLTQLH